MARTRVGGQRRSAGSGMAVVGGAVLVLVIAQGCTNHGASTAATATTSTTTSSTASPPAALTGTPLAPLPSSSAPAAPVTSPPAESAAASAAAGLALQTTVAPWVLPAAVYRTQAASVGGSVYVLGGIDTAGTTVADVYRLDPGASTVTHVGVLATPTHGAAALTVSGRILVFGGAATSVHNTVQAFDPNTGKTTVIGRLPGALADLTAAAVGNQVLLLGGFDGGHGLDTVWASADGVSFHSVAHLAQSVRYPAVAVQGNDVYLFGGLLAGGEYTGTFSTAIQRLDVTRRTVTVVGHLPIPLAHAKAVQLGGQLLVLGGSTTGGASAAIFRFDPTTQAVTTAGALPQPATDGAVTTIGDTAYLLGGISHSPLTSIVTIQLTQPIPANP